MQIAAVIFPSLVFPWRCFRGTISGNAFLPGSFHSSFTPHRINLSLPSREPHPWFCFLRWDHFHQNGLSWRGKDHFYFLFSFDFFFFIVSFYFFPLSFLFFFFRDESVYVDASWRMREEKKNVLTWWRNADGPVFCMTVLIT